MVPPFDAREQAIAVRGHHQRVIDNGQIDPVLREDSHRLNGRRGFDRHHALLASAQLLKQPDAQERGRRSDQDGAHAAAAVLT
jgi:hypothetical protein